ncbi:hypothetical protein B0J11DRAFT_145013 [Dendryphion nanum]|uniref:Uncharacterized protein n=1 Tax=Dendryphion nanum TaxID=256645 RepID=A0A9P9IB37_9PLEO|nr:hypothetical protein B0J11DRAFT_145013 [Dendryphion nanum]
MGRSFHSKPLLRLPLSLPLRHLLLSISTDYQFGGQDTQLTYFVTHMHRHLRLRSLTATSPRPTTFLVVASTQSLPDTTIGFQSNGPVVPTFPLWLAALRSPQNPAAFGEPQWRECTDHGCMYCAPPPPGPLQLLQ